MAKDKTLSEKNLDGKGYTSFRKCFEEGTISEGDVINVPRDTASFEPQNNWYVVLADGRLRRPNITYDNSDEGPEILGKNNRWEVLPEEAIFCNK